MRTLKNTLKIAALFVIAISFAAGAQQKPNAPVAKNPKNGNIYVSVQHSPKFAAGTKAFWKFLETNVKYPAADRENNIQGKVFVKFIVEPDGKLTDVTAVRGPSETLKTEAVRVMKMSPKWKPGIQGGKKVRTEYVVPINFTITES